MKYCSNCAFELDGFEGKFCPNCGASVSGKGKKKVSAGIVVVIVACICVALASVGFAVSVLLDSSRDPSFVVDSDGVRIEYYEPKGLRNAIDEYLSLIVSGEFSAKSYYPKAIEESVIYDYGDIEDFYTYENIFADTVGYIFENANNADLIYTINGAGFDDNFGSFDLYFFDRAYGINLGSFIAEFWFDFVYIDGEYYICDLNYINTIVKDEALKDYVENVYNGIMEYGKSIEDYMHDDQVYLLNTNDKEIDMDEIRLYLENNKFCADRKFLSDRSYFMNIYLYPIDLSFLKDEIENVDVFLRLEYNTVDDDFNTYEIEMSVYRLDGKWYLCDIGNIVMGR